jgi:hypothetical protein
MPGKEKRLFGGTLRLTGLFVWSCSLALCITGCPTPGNGNGERIPVESVSLNKTGVSLSAGKSERLIATVLPEDATDKTLVWSSSNEAAATVGQDGTVTVAGGAAVDAAAIITAASTDGSGKEASCVVTVIAAPVDEETNIGETASLGNRLYVKDFPVYDYAADGEIAPFEYEGTLTLTSDGYGGFYDMQNPQRAELPASITGGKINIDIGVPPADKLQPLADGLSSNPPGVKGVLVQFFTCHDIQGPDNYTDDIRYYIGLVNKNKPEENVSFMYAESDAVISGITNSLYWELSLKQGWNTVKYDYTTYTVSVFVPDDNYVWLNINASGSGEGFFPGIDIGPYNVIKISGTVSILVDGAFPAGGAVVAALDGNTVVGACTIPPSPANPASWAISLSGRYGWLHFAVSVYLDEERKTTYHYQNIESRFYETNFNQISPEFDEWELSDIELSVPSVSTRPLSLTITGLAGGATVYTDDAYYYLEDAHYRLEVSGNGSYTFRLPDTLEPNQHNETWLWFRIVSPSGRTVTTKGRKHADSAVTLNAGDMYVEIE